MGQIFRVVALAGMMNYVHSGSEASRALYTWYTFNMFHKLLFMYINDSRSNPKIRLKAIGHFLDWLLL